jgi:hypothetical protein
VRLVTDMLQCANANSTYTVQPQVDFGGFCCKHCYSSLRSACNCKKMHGDILAQSGVFLPGMRHGEVDGGHRGAGFFHVVHAAVETGQHSHEVQGEHLHAESLHEASFVTLNHRRIMCMKDAGCHRIRG